MTRELDKMPAFAWWVPYTLKKRDTIIASVQQRIAKTTHNYEIEIPTSWKYAQEIDTKNSNHLWRDALAKEMKNVGVAFDVLENHQNVPVGWAKATGHLVWDVKIDFTQKARWVKDGHRTAYPLGTNYAGVVSRDSFRIAFTMAAMNGLDICAADIQNAYIQDPTSEKYYVICGSEFGENQGEKALIRRALYGGKSVGRDYWLHLRSCMEFLGFNPCKADPNIWMRKNKRDDNTDYCEYILLYRDDCSCLSLDPESIVRDEIGKLFLMKEASISEPDISRRESSKS